MRPKTILIGILAVSFYCSTRAFAEDVVFVPSSQSSDAAFIKASDVSDGANKEMYTATGSDGASVVVGGRALVVGLRDAQFTVGRKLDSLSPSTFIERGDFQIIVGSKETLFGIGEVKLKVREAKITVVQLEEGYIISFDSQFNGKGKVQIDVLLTSLVPVSQSVSKAEQAEALPTSVLKTFDMKVGQVFLLKQNLEPVSMPEYFRLRISEVASRLASPSPSGAKLNPADVEHPSDLVAKMMDKDQAFEDIEIEDIEVEAGCVEVCLD